MPTSLSTARHHEVAATAGRRLLDLAAERALRRWRFDRGPARFEWTIEFRLDGGMRD